LIVSIIVFHCADLDFFGSGVSQKDQEANPVLAGNVAREPHFPNEILPAITIGFGFQWDC
jgi:hypothetical protein